MFHARSLAFAAVAIMGLHTVFAADAPPPPQPGFSLTIYSAADPALFDPQDYARQTTLDPNYGQQNPLPGYGVIRENREISLDKGDNTLHFTDVATGIDPTTVSFQSLTSPDAARVLEQNYEFDLVSADKLLAKYLDKEIIVHRRDSAQAPVESMTGTLLSFDPYNLVLSGADGKVHIVARGDAIQDIELAKSDSGLITKPTLVWKIHSDQAGKQLAQVTYQTDQITWRADYNVTVNANDDAADIAAWVTLMNQSGASYPDAKLKLVAGDVQRVKPPQPTATLFSGSTGMEATTPPPGFTEKSFFEYHLYTLGRTTSLPNNSTKQIELFSPRAAIPVTKSYVYCGVPRELRYAVVSNPNTDQLGGESNKKVDVYLQLTNSEKNGLGIPLPAGRIRVYKIDTADGSKEFVGEDVIQHTPKDEKVMIRLGSAFDIVGERKQTEFTVNENGHVIIESFQIKLRNHKTEPVDVLVKENFYRWTNWEITACSDKYDKQDFRTIQIPVTIPVDGEKTITYTVKYTW